MTRIPTYRPGANRATQPDPLSVIRLFAIPNLAGNSACPPEEPAAAHSESTAGLAARAGEVADRLVAEGRPASDRDAAYSSVGVADTMYGPVHEPVNSPAQPSETAATITPEIVRLDEPVERTLSFRRMAQQATSSWRRTALTVSAALVVGYVAMAGLSSDQDDSNSSADVADVAVTIPTDPVDGGAAQPLRVGPTPTARPAAKQNAVADPIFTVPTLQPRRAKTARGNASGHSAQVSRIAIPPTDDDTRERYSATDAARPQMIPPVEKPGRWSDEDDVRTAMRPAQNRFDEGAEQSAPSRFAELPPGSSSDEREMSGMQEYPTTPATSYHDPKYQIPNDNRNSSSRWR